MMKIKFEIIGKIKGKGRPIVTKRGHAFTPKGTVNYENLVKMYYEISKEKEYFGDKPLKVEIIAYFEIPKSYTKKKRQLIEDGKLFPTKKPDVDNIIKIVLDSLNKLAYDDDKQVIDVNLKKFYSDQEKLVVEITEIK